MILVSVDFRFEGWPQEAFLQSNCFCIEKPLNSLDEPVEQDYDDKMLEMLAFIRKSAEDPQVSSLMHLNPMFRHLL